MSALELIDQVPEFAKCVAFELGKIMEPHKDVISTNEAYKRSGRARIKKWTDRGQLHPPCHRLMKTYSISEIERVKAKENVAARLVIK